jgi:ubiquinone/menaquinone biosynthesis C-methylase UbiE
MATDNRDRMPDLAFRLMAATMAVKDQLFPTLNKRIEGFSIQSGMTLVDYGCGPGRYTTRFAKLLGDTGKVYAVDVHELALAYVRRKMREQGLRNIVPILASRYQTDIPDNVADMIFALDIIFGVKEPVTLLGELHRICCQEGVLIVDDGHQSRERTIQMIHQSGQWTIEQESRDHLRCVPVRNNAA